MSPEAEAAIRARVDELMLLESRCERRIQDFIKFSESHQNKDQKINRDIAESLFDIQESAQQLKEELNQTIRYRKWSVLFFCVMLVVGILIVLGGYGWSKYTISKTADAKLELSKAQAELLELETRLKQTPHLTLFRGKYYVRVNPESGIIPLERMNTREPMGSFAELWTSR